MPELTTPATEATARRARELFREYQGRVYRQTDRAFAALLLIQWLAALAAAMWLTPYTWAGVERAVHPHVLAALLVGGAAALGPYALALACPGRALTRHAIAAAQMLQGALLIHLTGGRIETHFHVFGSLAFLAFYRDWTVLLTGSAVVAVDHYARGLLWPQSVYGVTDPEAWRWLEHAGWVVFEDIFLVLGCARSIQWMREFTRQQAELEAVNTVVETRVRERTAALQAHEARLSAILDAALDAVIVADNDGIIREFSPTAEQVFGHLRAAAVGQPLVNFLLAPAHHGTPLSGWARDSSSGETGVVGRRVEVTAQRADGSEFPAEISINVVHLQDTSLFAASVRDISERRRVEAASTRLVAILEATTDLVAITQTDGPTSYINPAGRRMLGVGPDDPVALADFRPPAESDAIRATAIPAAIRDGTWSGETVLRKKDGHELPVSQVILAHKGPDGSVEFLSTIARDISRQKQEEEELRRAKEVAEAASRAKGEFLANMSHEIRTPMNGILGMTQLALETTLSPEQREYLTLVKTSGEALLTVLNDILDFSKIEAGKLELMPTDFPLRDTLADAVKTLAPRAHEKGLELAFHTAADVPDRLVGDPDRLRQVLLNLLGNALKFTERGEVVVRVGVEEPHAKAQRREEEQLCDLAPLREALLHFEVQDTGIGIPPEKQRLIFEAFAQADGSTTRKYGGTGLGLTICTRLVELMGGRLWVESVPERGSTFHFTARFDARPSEGPELPVLLAGVAVLVVDDNTTNRIILAETVRGWGMRPSAVAGAAEALAALEQAWAAGNAYPLVLLDAMMPEMDGFTLAERVRAHEGLDRTALVMLSSAGRSADAARCRALGVPYLTKPVKPSELLRTVKYALRLSGHASRQAVPALPSAAERPLRVLLAEDNAVNQRLVVRLLEKQGYAVTVAADGQIALDALEHEPFDVVLMDVQMPVLNGLEATAKLRERERDGGRRVPVIALTAHAMRGDVERCLDAGMDGYISKPIHVDDLLRAIATAVSAPVASAAD